MTDDTPKEVEVEDTQERSFKIFLKNKLIERAKQGGDATKLLSGFNFNY